MKLKINNKNKKNKRDYLSSGSLSRAKKLKVKALVLFTVILLSLIFQMDFPMNTNKNSEELRPLSLLKYRSSSIGVN